VVSNGADRDYVAELTRWVDAGATWRVAAQTDSGVTIALLRCDGGEEVDRFTSTDPALLEFVQRGTGRLSD
jgi:hypothetical protein